MISTRSFVQIMMPFAFCITANATDSDDLLSLLENERDSLVQKMVSKQHGQGNHRDDEARLQHLEQKIEQLSKPQRGAEKTEVLEPKSPSSSESSEIGRLRGEADFLALKLMNIQSAGKQVHGNDQARLKELEDKIKTLKDRNDKIKEADLKERGMHIEQLKGKSTTKYNQFRQSKKMRKMLWNAKPATPMECVKSLEYCLGDLHDVFADENERIQKNIQKSIKAKNVKELSKGINVLDNEQRKEEKEIAKLLKRQKKELQKNNGRAAHRNLGKLSKELVSHRKKLLCIESVLGWYRQCYLPLVVETL